MSFVSHALFKPIKFILRPLYHYLIKTEWVQTAVDKQQKQLFSAFDVFADMSRLSGINGVQFNNGNCVISLSDGRRYQFSPSVRAARLYSVPFIGTFEEKETACLRNLIQEGDVCVDVGASFGWYTILLSNLAGEQGRVYSFEPLPENLNTLKGNLAENNVTNVQAFSLALGEKRESTKIFLTDIGVSGSLRLHKYRNKFEEIDCQIDSFDSFVEQQKIEKLDFIKADIEGGELAFLKGALGSLKRFLPVLMLEAQEDSTRLFGYDPEEIFELLDELGYQAFYVQDGDGASKGLLQAVDRAADKLPDYNFIFIPESRSTLL